MSLESASFINQLVVTNPPGGDDRSTADDHLRLIKEVLSNQFTNFDNVQVTATPAELNGLKDLTASFVAQISTLGILEPSTVTLTQMLQYASTLTANKALYSDASNVVKSHASTTDTELGYLAGVTGAIQAQLNLLIKSKFDALLQSHGHGGDGAISIITDTTYSDDIYNATTFNINVAQTLTFDTPFAIIFATTSIVINGNINIRGVDRSARIGMFNKLTGSLSGTHNSAGPAGGSGGGGGGSATGGGNNGSNEHVALDRTDYAVGAGGGVGVSGSIGTASAVLSAAKKLYPQQMVSHLLGATKGGDGGVGHHGGGTAGTLGAGGDSGGLLLLIAPSITIGATSTINLDGKAGANGGNGSIGGAGGGGGGGGSGGVLITNTPSLTDSGTRSVLGAASGSGGSGFTSGGAGGAGVDGYSLDLDTTA